MFSAEILECTKKKKATCNATTLVHFNVHAAQDAHVGVIGNYRQQQQKETHMAFVLTQHEARIVL
jgi:arginine exporter protein ArgO